MVKEAQVHSLTAPRRKSDESMTANPTTSVGREGKRQTMALAITPSTQLTVASTLFQVHGSIARANHAASATAVSMLWMSNASDAAARLR